MSKCDEARACVLKHLMLDIQAHEEGRYSDIGLGERYFDWEGCAKEDEEEAERLVIVERLWDYWVDSRNHNWGYYPGVEEQDWPVIARQIYQGIVEKWEPDQMRDNNLFHPPPPPPAVPIWERIKNVFF